MRRSARLTIELQRRISAMRAGVRPYSLRCNYPRTSPTFLKPIQKVGRTPVMAMPKFLSPKEALDAAEAEAAEVRRLFNEATEHMPPEMAAFLRKAMFGER